MSPSFEVGVMMRGRSNSTASSRSMNGSLSSMNGIMNGSMHKIVDDDSSGLVTLDCDDYSLLSSSSFHSSATTLNHSVRSDRVMQRTSSYSRKISKRRVSFAERSHLIIEIQDDRSNDDADPHDHADAQSTWYSKQELESIRNESGELAEMYNAGKPMDLRNDCFRGLESRILPASQKKIRLKMKDRCIGLVLEEQHRQWSNAEWDPDQLARISLRETRQCQSIAFRLGRADYREARK